MRSYRTLGSGVSSSTPWRPAVVGGELVAREVLQLTLSFNHAVVDGAPAARAANELRELIEGASLLDEASGS